VRIKEEEYYCLFYRDIFPVGWNIANGGSDNNEELLNPLLTIERSFVKKWSSWTLEEETLRFPG